MKNNELLKKYAGISTRIRRIFAYHYDQIQREVQTEISTLTPELQAQFMDLVIDPLTGPIPMTKKHSKNNYSDNAKRRNNHLKQRTYENNKSFIKNHNQSEW